MNHQATVQIITDQHLILNGDQVNIHDIETIYLKENGQPNEYRIKRGKETIGIRPGVMDKISGHDIIAIEVQNNRLLELLKDASMVLHAVTTETSFQFDNLQKKIRAELNRNQKQLHPNDDEDQ
jgi:hypothetical protein